MRAAYAALARRSAAERDQALNPAAQVEAHVEQASARHEAGAADAAQEADARLAEARRQGARGAQVLRHVEHMGYGGGLHARHPDALAAGAAADADIGEDTGLTGYLAGGSGGGADLL